MSNTESRWVAVSALGAAMFAIGFSFAGVACSTNRDITVSEAARVTEAPTPTVLPAPAASLGTIAKVVNAPTVAAVVTPPPAPSAESKVTATEGNLKLKRIVVAHKIDRREPVVGEDFKIGSAPVYAFVEFENAGHTAKDIRVMFQNEETKATVGHVKLTVPGRAERFRTWGNTRLIRDPGRWVAVVSTTDGTELGRAEFDVKG